MDENTTWSKTRSVDTNKVKFHDNNGTLMGITFGNADQDGERCFLELNFKANESKSDFIINKHILNFVCSDKTGNTPELKFNDYKIWNQTNDGPNSGLNADLLDGRHATEFKDRYGYHHFIHQVNKANPDSKKNWVRVATFTTRKIGQRMDLDFKADGKPAYGGIFQYSGNGVNGVDKSDIRFVVPGGNIPAVNQALSSMDAREQFKLNTPNYLNEYDPDIFHSSNILTEGVYNGTLRGCVTLLKNNNPTTFDFHVGLFEDPLCTSDTGSDGGWTALKKYFYVSLHDETLPFLTNDDIYTDPYDNNLNKGYANGYTVNKDTDDINSETKKDGVVQNGYNNGNSRYPNFPYYSWDYRYNDNKAVKTYNNDVSDDVSSTHAMANLYFSKPDNTKAERLRELKCEYGNDYKLALETELARLKKLGLAMALNDDDGNDEDSSDNDEDPSEGDSKDNPKDSKFKLDRLDEFIEAVSTGSSNQKYPKDDSNKYDKYEKEFKEKASDDIDDKISEKKTATKTSVSNLIETHKGPDSRIDIGNKICGNYKKTPATIQDVKPYNTTRRRQPFPPKNTTGEGDAYQTYIDIMRLYHVDTRVDTIDGVKVTTHTFELYMAIDEKMEIRIQPYMSNACIVHNFQPCLQEADLPKSKFIRPKSIYDNRYASVRHRHYDYERRIWELTLEADQIWKNFKNYLTIDQGTDNAHKVMLTDKDGKIYAAEDNMVRHCEPTEKNPDTNEGSRRVGEKVLVTGPKVKRTIENCSTPLECSCVEESDVTLDELYQLKNVRKNIQEQIDDLWKALKAVSDELLDTLGDVAGDIWENIGDVWNALDQLGDLLGQLEGALANAAQGDFVRKTGDIMTGSLWIQYDGKKFKEVPSDYDQNESFCGVKFFSDDDAAKQGGYIYGASHNSCVGLGVARNKSTDREEDWALAVTPAIDSEGIPIMLNGTKIMFTRDGRIDGRNATTFTIDFDKINEFYKEEKGTYPK